MKKSDKIEHVLNHFDHSACPPDVMDEQELLIRVA